MGTWRHWDSGAEADESLLKIVAKWRNWIELLTERSGKPESDGGRRTTGGITGEPVGDLAEALSGASCCCPAAVARLLQVPFGRLLFRLYPASQLFVTHTVGDEHHIFAVIHHRYFNYRKSSRISRRTSAPIFSLMCLMMPSMASFSTMR